MPQRKGPGRGWVFRYTAKDPMTGCPLKDAAGKTIKKTSEEFRTKVLAEQAEATHKKTERDLRDRLRGRLPLPFAAVCDRWVRNRVGAGRSERNQEYVAGLLKAIATEEGWHTVLDVTADAVEAWHNRQAGVNRNLAYLKSVLRYSMRVLRQPIDPDVLRLNVRPQEEEIPPELLSTDEVAGILAAADAKGDKFGTMIRHLLLYGPRPITIAQIKVGDYDEVNRLLVLKRLKNNRVIRHPVHNDAEHHFMATRLSRLCAGRRAEEPLYTSATGNAWSISKNGSCASMAVWYRRHCADHMKIERRGTGLLKDYAISLMDAAGIPDRTKALYTGHLDLTIFARYKSTNREMAQAALAKIPPLPTPKASKAVGADSGATASAGAETGAETPSPSDPIRAKPAASPPQPDQKEPVATRKKAVV